MTQCNVLAPLYIHTAAFLLVKSYPTLRPLRQKLFYVFGIILNILGAKLSGTKWFDCHIGH